LKADVVVAAGENARVCLDALYRVHGAALGRVIAVCEAPSDARLLRELQGDRPELVVLQNDAKQRRITSWNRGLFLCGRDVLLLDSTVVLSERGVEEMLEVLHSSDRVASVVPITSDVALDADLATVPRSTDVATLRGSCVLVSHLVVNMIGGFDPAFERARDSLDDWAMRAQRMGLRLVRANRALAVTKPSPRGEAAPAPSQLLLARHPHFQEQANAALLGAEPRAAAHFVASRRGPVRVERAGRPSEPLEQFQVLYQSDPIDDAAQLLAVLESPCHLVLAGSEAYRNRALLFAAAHSAQAVVTASEQDRAKLIEDLGLDPATVEVVESESGLGSLFQRIVDQPRETSLRYRALLATFLRSLKRRSEEPGPGARPEGK